jgi:autotransporter-associated beta strand protein
MPDRASTGVVMEIANSRRRGVRLMALRVVLAAVVVFVTRPGVASASTYQWQVDAGGSWNVPDNWVLVEGSTGVGYPSVAGDIAVFDSPMTADRTIIIPTGVTIALGGLRIIEDYRVLIQAEGSGKLVFESPNGNAFALVKDARGAHAIAAPVQLLSDLDVVASGRPAHLTFMGGIGQDAMPARNVTISGDGSIRFRSSVPNTYAGYTWVQSGELQLQNAGGAIAIPGLLIVGDDTGDAGSARVRLGSQHDNIANSSLVSVARDGLFAVRDVSETIQDLLITNGRVEIAFYAAGDLTTATCTMHGGTLHIGSSARLEVTTGTFNATSTSFFAHVEGDGTLALNGAPHVFTVEDGPFPLDLSVDASIVGVGGERVTKNGPGNAIFSGMNRYAGDTILAGGPLMIIGDQRSSHVRVTTPDSILRGSGPLGPLTATAGTVSPGIGPVIGTLYTGPLLMEAGASLEIQIWDPRLHPIPDHLVVTGGVSLHQAVLALELGYIPKADASFLVIDNDGADAVDGTFAGLPEGTEFWVGGSRFVITYAGGDGNDVVLRMTLPFTYLLTEGATGTFFDDDVLIANPLDTAVDARLTFMLDGGATVVEHRTVPARSRITVRVDDIPGLESTSAAVQVNAEGGTPLIVERSMFWDTSYYAGHTASAVSTPLWEWWFAEGCQGFFDTYILLANPNAESAMVFITFLREGEGPAGAWYTVPPFSRVTAYAGDIPELVDRRFGMIVRSWNTLLVERSMYFASTPERVWGGGHVSAGAEPSSSWVHAEGASGGFFNTFLLLTNGGNVPANVDLRFLLESGEVVTTRKIVGPQQRLTVNPAMEGDARLERAAFSTVVTSDVPIMSERSMYWPGDATPFGEGHNSAGETQLGTSWGLAEGRIGGPMDFMTYILLANPGSTAAEVQITYLREGDTPVAKTYTVPPTSRFTLDVKSLVPEIQNQSFAALIAVTNNVPIAVERSMYWNANGVFWAGGTNALATRLP